MVLEIFQVVLATKIRFSFETAEIGDRLSSKNGPHCFLD